MLAYIIDFGCALRLKEPLIDAVDSNGDTRYFSPERLAFNRGETYWDSQKAA